MNPYLVFLIGIAAQILFSGRLLVQWIASERAKKVLSPTLFWQMSMAASFMLCVYGWLPVSYTHLTLPTNREV